MITKRFNKAMLRHRLSFTAMAALLTITFFAPAIAAQSGNSREEAIQLRMSEISGSMESASTKDYYYTFAVAAGEFVLTLDVSSENTNTAYAGVTLDLYDKNANTLLCCFLVQSGYGRSETGVKKVRIDRKQTLVLRVRVANGAGRYRLRLGGPIILPEANPLRVDGTAGADIVTGPGDGRTPAPIKTNGHGLLRIELADGSVQEIPLSRVRRLSVEP